MTRFLRLLGFLFWLGMSPSMAQAEVVACPDLGLLDADSPAAARQFRELSGKAPRLFRAILNNNKRTAKRYLAAGDDPNACALGVSLLGQAVVHGRMEIAEQLLQAGASLERPRNAGGETVLFNTIANGQFGRALQLIAWGANSKADHAGIVPLHLASGMPQSGVLADGDQIVLVRHLLMRGAGANTPTPDGMTPLLFAARNGNLPLIRVLLSFGADPALAESHGITPGQIARLASREDIAAALAGYTVSAPPTHQVAAVLIEQHRHDELSALLARIDLASLTHAARQALLVAAMTADNPTAISELVRRGVDPDGALEMAGDSAPESMSPLQMAVAYRLPTRVMEALIRSGANPDGRLGLASDSMPPLQSALIHYDVATARTLIRLGADPNVALTTGDVPALASAVAIAETAGLDHPLDLAKELLAAGAHINAQGPKGQSALHWAAMAGNTVAVRLLLDHGADPNIRDDQLQTPLAYAKKSKATAIVALLKPVTK